MPQEMFNRAAGVQCRTCRMKGRANTTAAIVMRHTAETGPGTFAHLVKIAVKLMHNRPDTPHHPNRSSRQGSPSM